MVRLCKNCKHCKKDRWFFWDLDLAVCKKLHKADFVSGKKFYMPCRFARWDVTDYCGTDGKFYEPK